MRAEATTYLQELDQANRAMSDEQRRQLTSERTRLIADVASLLEQSQAARRETQTDQAEARQLWGEMAAALQQRRAAPAPQPVQEAAPAAPEAGVVAPVTEPAPVPSTPVPAEPAHDDLMELRGIGPSMQRRLHNAHIFTFAKLAESNPEELRQAMGEGASLANVEEWIEQARERVRLA
jgi:predicted flap endonuclease-1-like 5' DNA nuclease